MFLYKPADKTGEARKFARPFHGPYCVAVLEPNTAKIRCVDKPAEEPILVSQDRLRKCPPKIGEEFWPPDQKKPRRSCLIALSTETRIPAQGMPLVTVELVLRRILVS